LVSPRSRGLSHFGITSFGALVTGGDLKDLFVINNTPYIPTCQVSLKPHKKAIITHVDLTGIEPANSKWLGWNPAPAAGPQREEPVHASTNINTTMTNFLKEILNKSS